MLKDFMKHKALPIGVDLGSTAVKMAQLREGPEGPELIAAAMTPMPANLGDHSDERLDFITRSIRQMLKNGSFKGRQCILAMPTSASVVRHVKISKGEESAIPDALAKELSGKLPFALEDAVVRHVIAGDVYGEEQPRQEIIAVAAARAILDSYLEAAHRSGLDVVGVNVESCAIVECFARLFRRTTDVARTILFIDMGARSTQVSLSHGSKLVFARNLAIGGERLDKALASGLNITPQQACAMRMDLVKSPSQNEQVASELYRVLDSAVDALAEEINQCLRYYESVFRNQCVERTIFVGGQAFDTRLCQSLAQRLNLPAQVGDPLVRIRRIGGAGMGIGLDRREPQPNWAVAIGLSLGASAA